MIEGGDKKLVRRIEQIEQKAVDRRAGVADPRPVHAVAGVQQQPESQRHSLVGELRDGLFLAVLENFERLARQVAHQMAFVFSAESSDRIG